MRYEPCRLVEGHLPFGVHIKNISNEGGSGDSLNVGMFLPDNTASQPKKGKYSKAPLNSHDGGD